MCHLHQCGKTMLHYEPPGIHLHAYTRETTGGEDSGGGSNKKKKRPGSNGEARGLFAGGPHRLFGPRIIIVAVAPLPGSVSAPPPLSLFLLSLLFHSSRGCWNGRCIATRTGLSLYLEGHEEANQPTTGTRSRPVRPEDGRHAEKTKREGVGDRGARKRGDTAKRGAYGDTKEQRRANARCDRCDEGRRRMTRKRGGERGRIGGPQEGREKRKRQRDESEKARRRDRER